MREMDAGRWASRDHASSYLDLPGTWAQTFGQETFTTTLSVSKLLAVYEVDLEVQRAINPRNLSKLMDYIMLYLQNKQLIYFPGLILSARGVGLVDHQGERLRLQSMDKLFVIDGQHRITAFARVMENLQSALLRAKDNRDEERIAQLTEQLRKLYAFPVSVMIYRNIDHAQERQLFADINKLPRKIAGNLADLRERRKFYHVLTRRLLEKDPLLSQLRVDYYSERGTGEGFQFSYSFFVELLIVLLEGRMKPTARQNSYHFSDAELEQAHRHATTYLRRLLTLLPPDRQIDVVWRDEFQLALALLMHEEAVKTGSFNAYSLEQAMRIIPHIPWNELWMEMADRDLSRRKCIWQTHQFLRDFYDSHPLLMLSDQEEAN